MIALFTMIKDFLKRHTLIPKATCLLLAVMLWGYISEREFGDLQFSVPISFENLPPKTSISKTSGRYVSVLIQGRNDQIKTFQVKNIKAVVDMRNPRIGVSAQYPVQIQRSEIPENIRVEAKQTHVEVVVERQVSKRLRIIPVVKGSVAEGHSVGSVKVAPEYVTAIGSPSVLDAMTSINTEDIPAEGAEKDIIAEVGLRKDKLFGLELSESTVSVTVPVAKEDSSVSLTVVPSIINAPDGWNLKFASESEVVLTLKATGNKSPSAEDIEVFADAASLNGDERLKEGKAFTVKLPLKSSVKKSAGSVEVLSLSPEEVEIKAESNAEAEKE